MLRLTQALAAAKQQSEDLEQRLDLRCQAALSELSARMAAAERWATGFVVVIEASTWNAFWNRP